MIRAHADRPNPPSYFQENMDGLKKVLEQYEVPIGLMQKLLALAQYELNLMIDDSSSMLGESDALVKQASTYVKRRRDPSGERLANSSMLTRWEEVEDRLHVIVDILAHVPTRNIRLSFLNRKDVFFFKREDRTSDQFSQSAHNKIEDIFNERPRGSTPIYRKLQKAFNDNTNPVMHYLFTDGEPNDASVHTIRALILDRPHPENSPLTFLSCTNNEDEAAWMKIIEAAAPFTAELDDYSTEKKEVLGGQGPAFPFTRGMWLVCQLVAAINPDDLDVLDEPRPFSKRTMDELLGRVHTAEEYAYYFNKHPAYAQYAHLAAQFAREDLTAAQILERPVPSAPPADQRLWHGIS